jgi:hypothetical protein
VASAEHHPLDDLARELGRENVSRKRALKLIGAALAGAVAALIPGVAAAAPRPPGRPSDKPEHAGYGRGGRFKGEPQDDYCAGTYFCFDDSDCGGGCKCTGWNPAAGREFCQ